MDGEWIKSTRAHLSRQYLRALECLASIWLIRGETGPAIEALNQAMASDPYRESSYQMLNEALGQEGNRARGCWLTSSCETDCEKICRPIRHQRWKRAYRELATVMEDMPP